MSANHNTFQIDIDWTLKVCVRKSNQVTGWTLVNVGDLDATLTISYWPVEARGQFDWEVAYATIEGIVVTDSRDKAMWALVERAVTVDFDRLDEIVNERVHARDEAA